jgi:hypothetical protein
LARAPVSDFEAVFFLILLSSFCLLVSDFTLPSA